MRDGHARHCSKAPAHNSLNAQMMGLQARSLYHLLVEYVTHVGDVVEHGPVVRLTLLGLQAQSMHEPRRKDLTSHWLHRAPPSGIAHASARFNASPRPASPRLQGSGSEPAAHHSISTFGIRVDVTSLASTSCQSNYCTRRAFHSPALTKAE